MAASTDNTVNWDEETLHYEKPHPRLLAIARLLGELPHRSLLDVGCSTGTLRTLLDGFEYHGCDITDLARENLEEGRFLQIDFNLSTDLSFFRGRGIDIVNISGVLEYLERPEELLDAVRTLLGPGLPLVVSIINFAGARFRDPARHHQGWVFKPSLGEFRELLAREGWDVERETPVLRQRGCLDGIRNWLAGRRGTDHGSVREQASQFILLARTREP